MAVTTPLNELNINILTQEQYNSAIKDPNQLYMITDYEEEKYELPVANASTLGGIKSGGDISINTSGIVSVNDDSHNHVISNIDNLQSTLDTKATVVYVDEQLANKVDKVSGKGLSANDYTTTEKNKLAGIAIGAEVNQNAFSNIVVGSTTIAADTETDSLTIAAGTGISVSGDATNDKVTITNSGVRSISSGSTNGTISVNTNGTSENVAVKGLGSAAYTASTAYDAAGTAQTKAEAALSSAKTYTDSALSAAKSYADTAAATVKSDLLNGAGTAYDTLKELGDLIDDNADAIDALETIASGKANATHTHAISEVSGLQSALDGKASSSHGTHVTYSTTAPEMDGTASAGSASTVARSNHTHPTDTSRAAKTDFDSHTGNTTVHITSAERTNWNAAKSHADSAHAPSNAEKNQNAFSKITVGSTTIEADTTTDTLTLVGSNVTITPDATNDKVTISVSDGSTSVKGVVQLTNSTSSTSTTTAATPNSVKSAYDLANTAKTNAATAQSTADTAKTNAATAQSTADTAKTNAATAQARADDAYALADAKEVNQNAFSNVVVGSTTIAADTKTDTLTFVAGSNVTITPDATNDRITIAATDTVYTHPTFTSKNSGLYKIAITSEGHVSEATAVTKADITSLGIPAQDTTYTLSSFGITATSTELNYVDGVTSNIQTQLDSKSATHDHPYVSTSGGTISGNLTVTGTITGGTVKGAVYNDYAEYRQTIEDVKAGFVVVENGDDTLSLCTERMMPGAEIVSDTFGFSIGESVNCKTPIAVSGRVLAYPFEDRYSYKPGDPVCSGPNGTVSKMTREEVREYPDRMIGTVSAIPEYTIWGTDNVDVDGRIWIKVK